MKSVNKQTKPSKVWLYTAFSAAAITSAASLNAAHIIGINLTIDGDAGAQSGAMASTDLAGATGVRVGNWNNLLSNTNPLTSAVYENGDAVGGSFQVSIALNGAAFGDRSTGPFINDVEMYNGVIDETNATGSTTTVTNIPFTMYDVYVYMRDDGADRAGGFTIGSTTYYARGGLGNPDNTGSGYVLSTDTTAGTSGASTGWDQGNYVRFTNLTGSSFDLNTFTQNAGNATMRNKWAGFQIVQVPEPGSAMLGLLGGTLALFRRRR